MKYFLSNVASNNSVVEYIFQSSVSENSRLGNNFRFILHKLNLNNRCMSLFDLDYNELSNMIVEDWKGNFNDNDFRVSQHMLELIERRDSLEPWILSRTEIQSVLDMLALE